MSYVGVKYKGEPDDAPWRCPLCVAHYQETGSGEINTPHNDGCIVKALDGRLNAVARRLDEHRMEFYRHQEAIARLEAEKANVKAILVAMGGAP